MPTAKRMDTQATPSSARLKLIHAESDPVSQSRKDGADPAIAYSDLIYAKNLWQNQTPPEEELPDEPFECREATPEEIDNVA